MSSLIGYVRGTNMNVAGNLSFDGQVPLLTIRQVAPVELSIYPRILTIIVCSIKERRCLIMCVLESFIKQGSWVNTTIRATKYDASIESVAPTAKAGIPARIA